MPTQCPHCRSSYIELLLEITKRSFFRCRACEHRWNMERLLDERLPRSVQVQSHSASRSTPRVRDSRAMS